MTDTARLTYSIPEAAHALGISRSTIYALIRDGALQPVKLGTRTLIPAAGIDRLLNGGPHAQA